MPDPSFWPSTLSQIAEIVRSVGLGIGGGVAAWIAFKALNLNRRRTDNDTKRLDNEAERLRQQAETLETDRRRLENDSYVKAIEQLGHEKMEVRLGAIYALERIARDADDFDLHWSIMESLCAYVRSRPTSGWTQVLEHSTDPLDTKLTRPPTDVEAVLTIFRRRSEARKSTERQRKFRLNFRYVDWSYAELDGIDLTYVDLWQANLDNAHFIGANLDYALLTGATARETIFVKASLQEVDFNAADITEAKFRSAQMVLCNLTHTMMRGTQFRGANLQEADFRKAFLESTNFSYWHNEKDQSGWTNGQTIATNLRGSKFSVFPTTPQCIWDPVNPPEGLDEIVVG